MADTTNKDAKDAKPAKPAPGTPPLPARATQPAPQPSTAPAGTRTTKVVEVESDATAAAGPHRPEPAKQRFHNPGNVPVARTATRQARSTFSQRVRATQDGFIYEARRRAGDVFTITDPDHFSKTWMEPVDGSVPEKTTGPNAAIHEKHDQTLAGKHAERTGEKLPATGAASVLDDE